MAYKDNGIITLIPGAYALPSNCKARVVDGRVIVSVKKRLAPDTPRCATCRHFSKGIATAGGHITDICLLRPKTRKHITPGIPVEQIYYATPPKHRSCPSFSPRPSYYDIYDSSDFTPS